LPISPPFLDNEKKNGNNPVSDDLKSIRILTVDDHPVVRNGIAGLVQDQPDMLLVGEASNGREAIQQFRAHQPDVTLMDLQMPEMSGVDAIIAIRDQFPRARIIVLTTYTGDVQGSTRSQSRGSGIPNQKPFAQGTSGCNPES